MDLTNGELNGRRLIGNVEQPQSRLVHMEAYEASSTCSEQ